MTHVSHEDERCPKPRPRHSGGDARARGPQCSERRKSRSGSSCYWCQSFNDVRLAGAVSTGRLESTEGQTPVWASAETRQQEAEMDLRRRDTKEPIAAQVCVCPLDARNGSK